MIQFGTGTALNALATLHHVHESGIKHLGLERVAQTPRTWTQYNINYLCNKQYRSTETAYQFGMHWITGERNGLVRIQLRPKDTDHFLDDDILLWCLYS